MRQVTLSAPDLMLFVGTRVALGVGVGLLVAGKLDDGARKGAGIALLIVGALTTVPILLNVRAGSARIFGKETGAPLRDSTAPETERHGAGAFHGTPMPQ